MKNKILISLIIILFCVLPNVITSQDIFRCDNLFQQDVLNFLDTNQQFQKYLKLKLKDSNATLNMFAENKLNFTYKISSTKIQATEIAILLMHLQKKSLQQDSVYFYELRTTIKQKIEEYPDCHPYYSLNLILKPNAKYIGHVWIDFYEQYLFVRIQLYQGNCEKYEGYFYEGFKLVLTRVEDQHQILKMDHYIE